MLLNQNRGVFYSHHPVSSGKNIAIFPIFSSVCNPHREIWCELMPAHETSVTSCLQHTSTKKCYTKAEQVASAKHRWGRGDSSVPAHLSRCGTEK